MKAERLFRAIGLVDEGLIEAAAETPAKKRPSGGGMRLQRPA